MGRSGEEGGKQEIERTKKGGKTWKRREPKGNILSKEATDKVGQKRGTREIKAIGLDDMELEEMRIFKKVGVEVAPVQLGENQDDAEEVAGPTEWALGAQ